MNTLVPPHGSLKLKPLLLPSNKIKLVREYSKSLNKVPMSSMETSDLLLLSMGAYTPLNGFMGRKDWYSVCKNMKLSNNIFWPIPITLSISEKQKNKLSVGDTITLYDETTKVDMGILKITEFYIPDRDFECRMIFKTLDKKHPGVLKLKFQKPINIAGSVQVFNEGWFPKVFNNLYIKPEYSRRMFESLKWKKVTAFQTRNPMHRSHEFLVKSALESTDGVFIHHTIGKLKKDDIPPTISVKATKKLIDSYFIKNSVIQAGYPIEMRYAGPREALIHALIRQNFGCSHLIVGRDHAGVSNYYGMFDSQKIFDKLWKNALIIKPFKIDVAFYCIKCDGMATAKTCPHNDKYRIHISGTLLRKMLSTNKKVSPKFSRPEVVKILKSFYKGKS